MTTLAPLASELDAVRSLLAEQLPYSPRDYIPGISRRGDRQVFAEQLCGTLAAGDDLRFLTTLADGTRLAIFAERLAWDSEFFGYGMGRLHAVIPLESPLVRPLADYRPALEAFVSEARRRSIRYLLAVVDPRELAALRALGELGFALIETRYYHHGTVNPPPPRPDRLPIRLATVDDIPSLAEAARQTINPYDRFHADPLLDPDRVAQLMEKWVEQSIVGSMADVTIVPDVPRPAAFVTYRYHREHWARWGINLVQGMLSAVAPEFMGWMDRLDLEVLRHLKEIGAQHSFGSTQVTNRAIIWFAQEAGARFGRCEHVLRSML